MEPFDCIDIVVCKFLDQEHRCIGSSADLLVGLELLMKASFFDSLTEMFLPVVGLLSCHIAQLGFSGWGLKLYS